MMKFNRKLSWAALLIISEFGGAQYCIASPDDGFYLGAETGVAIHHFTLEETTVTGKSQRDVNRAGVAGDVFAGYEKFVSENLRIAVEGGLQFGGRTAAGTISTGEVFSIDPSFGYSVTGRAGYRVGTTVLPYVGAGYGGHRYGLSDPAAANGFGNWNHSFILLAGLEVAVSPRFRFRVEAMHLDGTRNHLMLGVPIRF